MECSQPSFWLDVTKTFIGALLGAGLAFTSALLVQWSLRRTENIKAGNLALTLLRYMLVSFLALRKAQVQIQDEVRTHFPEAPPWVHFKPSQYPFSESTAFDLSALAFLFDKHGTGVIEKLIQAEANFRSLQILIATHRETREQIQ